jgi:hypothetical protein
MCPSILPVIRLLDGNRAYLDAVIDNFSSRILAWRVDDPSFHVIEASPDAVSDDVVNDVNAVESTVIRVRVELTTSRL